jgi:NAD(P)H-nitrite reductase large subunit
VIVGGEREVPFDRLLIASGSDPRGVKAEGAGLPGIFPMRTAAQVQRMLALLPSAQSALVLGGGLVGFKAAHALLRRGLRVTMLIASAYPLSMQVDETAGMLIREEMSRHGLEVQVRVEALSFEGGDRVRAAHLSNGSSLPCDLVVVGKGVLPALGFVPRDHIAVDLGILVDRFMETSTAGIYAAGDVAEAVDIARQRRWVNAIWPEAAAQGMVAGMNMAGRRVVYPGSLSRNVMRIFGLEVMTGGLVNPADGEDCRVFQHHDPRRGTYRKLVFRDRLLVGAVLAGDIAQGGMLLSLIRSRLPSAASPETLLSPALNYRHLMPAGAGRG